MSRIYSVVPGEQRRNNRLWLEVPQWNIQFLTRRYRHLRKAGFSALMVRYWITDLLLMGSRVNVCDNYGHSRHETR
jgi:hypothetical protein